MSWLVTALFHNSDDLERAIDALIATGVAPEDLSLMVSRSAAAKYFGCGSLTPRSSGAEIARPVTTLASKLVTVASGSTNILATGALVTLMARRGTNAATGAICAALCRLGMSEHEAVHYEYCTRNCDALLLGVTTTKGSPEGLKAYLKWFDTAGARDSLVSGS